MLPSEGQVERRSKSRPGACPRGAHRTEAARARARSRPPRARAWLRRAPRGTAATTVLERSSANRT